MSRPEDLTKGTSIKGVLPDGLVTVVDVKWIGTVAVELTYKDASGRLGNELLYRDREPTLEVVTVGRPWSFDGDGRMFHLVSEAHRIGLAYLLVRSWPSIPPWRSHSHIGSRRSMRKCSLGSRSGIPCL